MLFNNGENMDKEKLSLRQKIVRKVGSMQLLALSFLFVILSGSILLSLPFSNVQPVQPYIDNLFVATSATCVTGLVPFAIVEQYSRFGQIIILILMQVGGLGLMTLLSLVMLLMKHKLFIQEKKIIQASLSKENLQDVPKFLKSIVKYTLVFETIGMILISIRFIPMYGLQEGLFNALFLSVSAFCNAGIDNITRTSMAIFATDPLINFTICGLIITGGLGFVVWLDLRKTFIPFIQNKINFRKFMHSLTIHTKVVLIVTVFLLASGTIVIYLLESQNMNTLGWMNEAERWMAAFFQSTTLRTAGFSTVDIALLKPATQFVMCMLMFIGGSPGGTAGGIKTTTFAMLFIFVISILKNAEHINVMKRDIPRINFVKAYVVTFVYLSSLVIAIFILSVTENLPFLSIIFECFSAIATVGLSMGITPLLSIIGKLVIIVLMFVGRVGPITIVISIFRIKSKTRVKEISYPHGDILIG